jgi:hypothetical protein
MHSQIRVGNWTGLNVDYAAQKIECDGGTILEKKANKFVLNFISFNTTTRRYNDQRSNYKSIVFPDTFNLLAKSNKRFRYLYFRKNTGNYKLSNEKVFRAIINPKNISVDSVVITDDVSEITIDGRAKTISLPIQQFIVIMGETDAIRKRSSSYSKSVENYLSNQTAKKYNTSDIKKDTTSINTGEFTFVIDRLNLPTKKNKKDLTKYLNIDDIKSIENLTERMLRFETFSEDFMHKINDYFIKEKLQDIIKIGREILTIGKTDLSNKKAKDIVAKFSDKQISQLETVWQEYFKKYLLFLIFSYKKIFSKVELNDVEGDKKYPDFIGINHYNGLDIIEIKTHLASVLQWDKSHKNFYFSAEISKAIVQAKNYMDLIIRERFKNQTDKIAITQSTDEENLYHPRAIIIISSADKLTNFKDEPEKLKRDFTKLRNGLHDIEILTFDEVLDIADEYITNISEER